MCVYLIVGVCLLQETHDTGDPTSIASGRRTGRLESGGNSL